MVGKWHLCPERRDEPGLDPAQLATRPRLRALLRVPGSRDEPVVPGPGLRQPPGRSAALARGRLPPHRRHHRQGARVHQGRQGDRARQAVLPLLRPRRGHAPHHAPKEWIDKYQGQFDMGYEAIREQILARQKELGIVPDGHRAAPDQPHRHARDPDRPGRAAVPADSTSPRPWDSPVGGREAAVLAAWPRSTPGSWPRRPPHRPAARLPGRIRAARQHARRRRVRQRRQRRGRPERLGQREQVLQRHPRRPGARTWRHRRAGQPEDLQPLPHRLGHGLQHAVQDVEALRVQRRHRDPCIISWPDGIKARGEIRHQYHHAIDLVPTILDILGVEPPETIKGHVSAASTGSACATASTTPTAPQRTKTQFYSMLGSRAIWHDGWKAVTTHPAIAGWGHFNDDTWELYHTDVDRSELHDLAAEQPGQAARDDQPVVRRGRRRTRRSRSTTAPRWRSS